TVPMASLSPGDQIRRHTREPHVRNSNLLSCKNVVQRLAVQQIEIFLIGPVFESQGSPQRAIHRESFSAQGAVSQVRRIGHMSTRRSWKFRTAPTTAIL